MTVRRHDQIDSVRQTIRPQGTGGEDRNVIHPREGGEPVSLRRKHGGDPHALFFLQHPEDSASEAPLGAENDVQHTSPSFPTYRKP